MYFMRWLGILCFRKWSMHLIGIQKEYLQWIKVGKKTVEGRINSGKYTEITVGSELGFHEDSCPDDIFICSVTAINHYDSFEQMLTQEGLQKCLPGIQTMQEGIAIYRQFPGYKENESICGVLAIQIKIV